MQAKYEFLTQKYLPFSNKNRQLIFPNIGTIPYLGSV